MTLKKTLLMAVLLAVLGGYAYRAEQERLQQEERALASIPDRKVLPGVTKEAVTRLRVVRAEGTYRVRRMETGGWEIEAPLFVDADPRQIDAVLESLLGLRSENTIEPGEALGEGDYGLSPPALLVELEGSFGTRVFSFGKKHSITGRRYLQPEKDGRIFLVEERAFALLDRPPSKLRDHFPVRIEAPQVTQLVALAHGAEPLVFRRQADPRGGPDRWALTARGQELEADGDLVRKELQELASLQVEEFIDNPEHELSFYGLEPPLLILRAELALPGGASVTRLVQIGHEIPDDDVGFTAPKRFYLKVGGKPTIFVFSKPIFSDWLQPPEHFRDRTPFDTLTSDDISRIVVKRGDGSTFSLRRLAPEEFPEAAAEEEGAAATSEGEPGQITERWELQQPAGVGPAQATVPARLDEWLEQLFRLKVLSYPAPEDDSLEQYGLKTPLLSIELEPSVREQPGRALLIGGPVQAAGQDGGGEQSTAPRYGAVVAGGAEPAPVVLSGATLPELGRSADYFLKE